MRIKLASHACLLMAGLLATSCSPTPTAAPSAEQPLPNTTANAQSPAPTLTPISLPTIAPPIPTPTLLAPTSAPATQAPTAAPLAATPKPTAVPGINLRMVDWRKFLITDKAFKHESKIDDLSKNGWPYIGLVGKKNVSGFAMLGDRIAYGDISGDGRDEALVSLFSGGTAGNLGLLVFTGGAAKPELVAALPGYKIGGVFEGGVLKVSQPQYAGFEPNCCPSGLSLTRYKISEGTLAQISQVSEGIPEARAPTVEKFYNLLNLKKFKDAYAFLSPGYQQAQPFDAWSAGYKDTLKIEATDVRQRANGSVSAYLKSTDKTGRGPVLESFHVVWVLVWDGKANQWRLDSATVGAVNGRLSGALQYPSSGIPPLSIFARNGDTGDVFSTETKRNQSSWSMAVPAGTYVVFAYLSESFDGNLVGGYSDFVTCGLQAGCPSHKLIAVKVEANKTITGVDVSDWYAPAGTFPARP